MPSNIQPSAFIPWKKPVSDVHPRLWITNRRRVSIGAIAGGSFTHGSTITWSGGSGKVVSNTANGAPTLYYEPVSGTQVANGQTISQGGVTTVASAAAVADGLTVAAAIAKTAGNAYWTEVVAYANRNDTTAEKSNAAWQPNQDWTRLACLSISYLLTGNTTHGNRARDVAVFLCGLSDSEWDGLSESGHRERCLSVAFAYDYCWPLYSTSQRDVVARKLKTQLETINNPDSERLWGTDHGKMCYALASQIAILEEGTGMSVPFTTGECNDMVDDVDTMMDALDNGTSGANGDSFFSAFRYFGDVDKGTHKGSGSKSYFTVNEEFYSFLMPAVRSGLVFDMYADNPWFKNTMEWIFQHLRTDFKSHTQGDHRHLSNIIIDITTAAHALQVVERDTDYVAKACQWFVTDLVPFIGNQPFSSSNNLFPFMFGRSTAIVPKVPPTLADFNGGKKVKDFEVVGKTIFRTGFPGIGSTQQVSLALHWPRYMLADHQHRDMGALMLEGYGEPMLIHLGHYDPNQSFTFQTSLYSEGGGPTNWEDNSGHRHSFQMQSLSYSTVRIFNEGDDDNASLRLNGYQKSQSVNSSFGKSTDDNTWVAGVNGVSNHGGFQWPKNTGDTDSAAETLEELLNEPKWSDLAVLSHKSETAQASYRVVDGKRWFWSGKCTRWKRHVLMLHEDQIPGFPYPVFIIWDDIISALGTGPKGTNKTQLFQLCTTTGAQAVTGGGASCLFQRTGTSPKLFFRMVRPESVGRTQVGGTSYQAFQDADGVLYPPNATYPEDDSVKYGAFRNEWFSTNASTTRNFMVALMPTPSSVSTVPSVVLIDEAGFAGVTLTFGATVINIRMAKGDVHSFTLGVPDLPAAPTGLVAIGGDAEVDLDWDNNPQPVDHYNVYRGTKVAGVFGPDVLVATPAVSILNDATVANGTTYRYRVSAVNTSMAEGPPSAYTADVTPAGAPPPPPPATPTGLGGVAGNSQVSLTWNDNAEGDLLGYRVYRAQKFGGVFAPDVLVASPAVSEYLDLDVVNAATYKYRVTAVNDTFSESGPTAYTAELTPTALPTNITTPNEKFSAELFIGAVPMPTLPFTVTDSGHLLDLYSGVTAQPPPPPDISIGAPIVPDEDVDAPGAPIGGAAGPLGGAPIVADVGPLAGAPIAT